MIRQLHIRNFQSHSNTILNFLKGINVIVGDSQHGKSAIVKALRKQLTNRPLGDRFVHDWKKKNDPTVIEIQYVEDPIVRYVQRGKSKRYETIVGDKKRTFKKFKDKVPDEILRLSNMGDLNIQTQLDQHFIMTDSPQQVTKRINKILRFEDVEKWKIKLTRWYNKFNTEISTYTKQIGNLERKIEHYKGWNKVVRISKRTNQLSDKLENLEEKYESLTETIKRSNILKQQIKILSALNKKTTKQTNKIDALLSKLEQQNTILKTLESIVENKNLITLGTKVKHTATALSGALVNVFERQTETLNLLNNIINLMQNIEALKNEKEGVFIRHNKLMKTISICPLCEQQIETG